MDQDVAMMRKVLKLAEKGWGYARPNPLVGALIVKDGRVLAEGYHACCGEAHAERAALEQAVANHLDVRSATLYVNLEPCSHHGRTPPCCDTILDSGIRRVVIAMADPNPLVSGRGLSKLRQAGIEVVCGVLETEARKLNEIFVKYITTGLPFVLMKAAMTLDGKIASVSGDSRWISCEASRQLVHQLRARYSAILIGSRTVINDNPALTTRLPEGGQNPLRVVVDSRGITPDDSQIFDPDTSGGVIIATTSRIGKQKQQLYKNKGARVWILDGPDEYVNLIDLFVRLGKEKIDSVLLEGGGGLNFAALECGAVDKIMFFLAPKIIGGTDAATPVEGLGIAKMQDALRLNSMSFHSSGEDILIEGYPDKMRR